MLNIENLNLKIDNQFVLQNITFSAKPGEITVITGANGSGKTTLLKAIAGICNISSGKIFFGDVNITAHTITQRANEGLSIAFQHPALFKGITVQNLLEIANKNAKNLDVACAFLSQVGLCARDYINREFTSTLSGGERKRIELALLLAKGGAINLFDEPESGIDMWSFDDLAKIFETLKEQKKVVLIVSHNQKIIEKADNLIVFDKGQIIKMGAPKDVLEHIKQGACTKLAQGGQNA
ncbi:MAG: ATP-binding cassette domain-containing protein [Clostridia bacterium]|nr:ATP-binding cassette domain-containing protein [Clostridia bacterium]